MDPSLVTKMKPQKYLPKSFKCLKHKQLSRIFYYYKTSEELLTLNFTSNFEYEYNLPITMKELQYALSLCKESSPG